MLKDYAKGVVLEELKDENLGTPRSFYTGEMVEVLRRIPDVQRQNFLAELYSRTTRTVYRRSHSAPEMILLEEETQWTGISSYEDVIEAILRENGW